MIDSPWIMFLVSGLLTALATVPDSLGLLVAHAASSQNMAAHSAQYWAGNLTIPHFDLQAHWDENTLASDTPPKVHIPSLNVTMIGKVMVTHKNRTLAAYQGIKYGQFQRFKHSTVAGRYWGDADQLTVNNVGEKCSQKSLLGHFSTGVEDCLLLNIYVPELELGTPADLLPVMLFIHGGAFMVGQSNLYPPTRLLDKDVVLVVIQYRLGALGWLSLQTDDVPGNAGLSDQITALKWVQLYIADFGGNPDRVTIFGESAGAASVSLLQTIGPVTEGLFAGVIGQSGSALVDWAIDEEPLKSAWKFSEFCGCSTNSENAIFLCLMGKTHEEISLCTHDMEMRRRLEGDMSLKGTTPVVQGTTVSEENRLIIKMPSEYLEAGEAMDVPLMTGANRDEGSYIFAVMFLDYFVPNGLVNDSSYIENSAIRDVMGGFGIVDPTQSLSEVLREKFFPDVDMSSFDAICPGMIDMSGLFFLKGGTYEVAKLHSTYYKNNTFFYSLDRESNSSMFNSIFAGRTDEIPFDHGVSHTDDLMYLFIFPTPPMQEADLLTSDRMVTLWTNFAKYGNPTPDEEDNYSELGLPKWQMLEAENLHYLLIQDQVTVESDYTKRWTIEMDLLNPVP